MTSFSFTANTFQDVVNNLENTTGTMIFKRENKSDRMTDDEWLDYINKKCQSINCGTYPNLDHITIKMEHDKTLYRAIVKRDNNGYYVEGTIRHCFTAECKQCGHILYFDKYVHNENDIEDKDNYICEKCRKNGNQ